MAGICVVHLVRAINGPEPLARFLASYARANTVAGQELAIVYKGFEDQPDALADCQALLADHPHHALRIPDAGFDLGPYFFAARNLDAESLCFLNSFSEILDTDWLAKMRRVLEMPGVGIVGATASCASIADYMRANKAEFLHLPIYNSAPGRVRFALSLIRYRRWFASFPNPHVRSNGFLVRRETFLRVNCPPLLRKNDAHRFESGVNGITRQIQRMGLRPLVVGGNGVAYEIAEWPDSGTYEQGNQENLLIADNKTRTYQNGDDALRLKQSRSSWGPRAAPALGAARGAAAPQKS